MSTITAPRIGPRRDFGYWLGGGLMAFAVIGAFVWMVLAFGHIANTVDDFQRIPIPGTGDVRLEARKYVIYVEGPRADEAVPPVNVAITKRGSSARPPILQAYDGSLTYSVGKTGSAQATVTPRRAGVYHVRTTSGDTASSFQLALGNSLGGKIVSAVVGALVIGAVLGIAGIVLLIRTRRRRRTAQVQSSPSSATP